MTQKRYGFVRKADDYKTYVLEGTATNGEGDYFAKTCSGDGQKTCDCGGPVEGSCDDKTGEWTYSSDCPQPLPDETVECGKWYTGTKTRHGNVCSGGTYTYGNWEESCVPRESLPKCAGGTELGDTLKDAQGQPVTDQQGNELVCVEDCSSGNCEYSYQNGRVITENKQYRTNTPYEYAGTTFEAGVCLSDTDHGCVNSLFKGNSVCSTGSGTGARAEGCANSIFTGSSTCVGSGSIEGSFSCIGSTFTDNSACQVGVAYGCAGATFEGNSVCRTSTITYNSQYPYRGGCASTFQNGGHCQGRSDSGKSGSCSGATFKSGGYCISYNNADCSATYQAGSWCERGNTNNGTTCPAGSPAGSGGKAIAGKCWCSGGKSYSASCCNN